MFIKCLLINQVQTTILMILMFLSFCNEKKNKKTCRCAFKEFHQLHKVEINVSYTLLINMKTFVSSVVFWRYLCSKIVWFIKILFYRFVNLSLAISVTCFLFFCILSLMFLKSMFPKSEKTCIPV